MNQKTILVVEDEQSIVTLIKYNLEQSGFAVKEAYNGKDALKILKNDKVDAVLLDWMLPQVSGIEICHKIRQMPQTSNIPVIMLTARGEENDKVKGLNTGADDYVTKPFSPKELIARLKAVLRRVPDSRLEGSLEYEDVTMNLNTFRVRRAGTDVHLGPTEFRLLKHFMENPENVYSREQLLNSVWGESVYVEPRTVDVHIRRLRKALSIDETAPDIIRTVRSAGYALRKAA